MSEFEISVLKLLGSIAAGVEERAFDGVPGYSEHLVGLSDHIAKQLGFNGLAELRHAIKRP